MAQCILPAQALLETVVKMCWAFTETLQSSRNCFSAAPFLVSSLSILLKTGCADSGVGMLEFLWKRRTQREPVPAKGLTPQLLWGSHCWSTAGTKPRVVVGPLVSVFHQVSVVPECPDTAQGERLLRVLGSGDGQGCWHLPDCWMH